MDWFITWTPWHWLGLGFLLLIAEIAAPGVFLLWWGLAAVAVSALAASLPTLSGIVLTVIYALSATLLSLLWWKYQHGKDHQDQAHTTLNQLDHAMIGKKGSVQSIAENGIGRGAFGDTTWRITGEGLKSGDVVEVTAVQGITLSVKKYH